MTDKSKPHSLSPLQGESLQGEPLSTLVERGKQRGRGKPEVKALAFYDSPYGNS